MGRRSSRPVTDRDGDAVLIAAQSGRALAQAARRAGLRPFVLDLFGDADLAGLAEHHLVAAGRFGSRLGGAVPAQLDALAALAGPACLGIVLGSGFEGAPCLIRAIASRHRLLGASADTVAALKDPLGFAALCARLSVPHPAVSLAPVADPSAWLLKRAGGSGGGHIRAAGAGCPPRGAYFQERVAGTAHALCFLADGTGVAVVGLSEQWSAPTQAMPYRYGGALERGRGEPPALAPALLAAVTRAVAGIVAATGLRGLASADLLVSDDAWWLMEVNPRPGATLDVLDRRAAPLLRAHIAASLGRLTEVGPAPEDAAAAEICYATKRFAAPPAFPWPIHARDRPRPGVVVGRGAPLCTILAGGRDAAAARHGLRERAMRLHALIDPEGGPR